MNMRTWCIHVQHSSFVYLAPGNWVTRLAHSNEWQDSRVDICRGCIFNRVLVKESMCLCVCMCVRVYTYYLIFVCMRMCMFVCMYVYVHNHSHVLMCHKPSCNNAHFATLPAQCIATSQFHLTWCARTHAKKREKLCECVCVCVRARIHRKIVKDSNPGSVLRRLKTTWCVCVCMRERVGVCKSVCVCVHERESVHVCGWERKREKESVC